MVHTVRRLYFATAVFTHFLSEIFIKFKNQKLIIPKHPLHAQFDEVLVEIFEVEAMIVHTG